jgi:hypothetical protein
MASSLALASDRHRHRAKVTGDHPPRVSAAAMRYVPVPVGVADALNHARTLSGTGQRFTAGMIRHIRQAHQLASREDRQTAKSLLDNSSEVQCEDQPLSRGFRDLAGSIRQP